MPPRDTGKTTAQIPAKMAKTCSYLEIATLPGVFLGMGALNFAGGFPGGALGRTVSISAPAALSSRKSQGLNEWVTVKPYEKIMSGSLESAFRKKLSAQSVLARRQEPEPCVQAQNLTVAGIAVAWGGGLQVQQCDGCTQTLQEEQQAWAYLDGEQCVRWEDILCGMGSTLGGSWRVRGRRESVTCHHGGSALQTDQAW